MSDTPEVPTPEDEGAVTPTPETPATQATPETTTPEATNPETPAATASEGAVPAADAQPEQAATTTAPGEKKSRTGLFIGIGVGALVLLIGAIVAVVLLVLPLFGGGVGAAANPVRDYAAEPEKDWKYDFAGDSDDDYLEETPGYTSIGTDKVLVWPRFDSSAWQDDQSDSYGWYEGYDADYDLAYDNGVAYNAAREAWYDDFSKPYPDYDEYYLDEWNEAENYRGFYDGFYDGTDGEEKGANRIPAPKEPDFTPVVTLVNLNDGKALWSLDLGEAADATYESYYTAREIDDTSYIALSVSSEDGGQLLAIDRNSGEVKSTLESDGNISYTAVGGDIIVLATDEEGDGTVSRISAGDLDGDAKWENKVKDVYSVGAIGDDYVRVSGSDDGEVFLAADGEDADWGDDIGDEGVNYALAGDQLMRIELDDDEYEIEGWNFAGESTWEDSITTEWYYVTGDVLLIGEPSSGGYEDIQRINPANGQEMWEDEYSDEISGVGGVLGDRLFVANPKDRLLSINLANGEEIYSTKVGTFGGSWFGTSKLYVVSDDELLAFNGNDKKELWSFDLDDDESIAQMGDRFVLVDTKKREIHGLK